MIEEFLSPYSLLVIEEFVVAVFSEDLSVYSIQKVVFQLLLLPVLVNVLWCVVFAYSL